MRGVVRYILLRGCTLIAIAVVPACLSTHPDYSTYDHINDQGYRSDQYRAPTPTSVPHADTIDIEALQGLLKDNPNTILIDVRYAEVRPAYEDLFPMEFIPADQRYNIPGSHWLPNVGTAELDKQMDDYFRHHLTRITDSNKSRAIVIYCIVDCWMSWNAVQRAASYGYTNLYWYPDGSDGWEATGLPLQKSSPVPLTSE